MINSKIGGTAAYTVIIGVVSISILLGIIGLLLVEYSDIKRYNPEPLGGKALNVFSVYQDADEAMSYVDTIVPLALSQSVYDMGAEGFMPQSSQCGIHNSHPLWSRGNTFHVPGASTCSTNTRWCVPSSSEVQSDLVGKFNSNFDIHSENYKFVYSLINLPKASEYNLELRQETGTLAVATTINPISFTKGSVSYSFDMAFKEKIGVDLMSDFQKLDSRARSFLNTRSNTIDDPDMRYEVSVQETCSSSRQSFLCKIGTSCNIPNTCKTVRGKTICQKGTRYQKYCEYHANIKASPLDEAYSKSGTDPAPIKLVVSENSNSKTDELNYDFAMHWVELKDTICIK